MVRAARSLARETPVVIRGTVLKVGATTLDLVEPTDRTAVVRVEEVLRAPEALAWLAGHEVTMVVAEGGAIRPGRQVVFFTYGWLYGASVALVEVDRADPSPDLIEAVDKVVGEMSRAELHERMSDAALVVAGTVTVTRRLEERPVETEHDPEWCEATIQVEDVLRGDVRGKTVTVLFPASLDVAWYGTPKLTVNQRGIWILHRGETDLLPKTALTALRPIDHQTFDRLGEVREALG